jgi:glycosyltransferase involved in cell wall biosynthesis
MDFSNKKIALIFGQSIEGCGVTRTGAEMKYWADKNNVDLTVYSYDERMYNRREAHAMEFVPFVAEDIPDMVKVFNDYDAVIFNSYPSNKFPKESISAFYEDLVKQITTVKVGFMHELNKTNIDKVPYLVGMMNEMDLIYNFGEETWFANTISTMLPSKKLGERVKKFTMWFNFDMLEKYRNEVKLEDKEKKLLYLGRWTTLKDPKRVLDLGPILLEKDKDFKSELIGIERSIGAKFDIFDHPSTIDYTGKIPKHVSEDSCVPVYGPYVREEGMEQMAASLFGCSFYRLPKAPEDYGDRMEYTQIEIIATGSIPVFDIHWAKNNKRRNGVSYFDTPYSGVYSDDTDLQATADKLVEISNDIELQKKYRDVSYQIAREEFDADIVLPEMLSYIFKVGKDKNKFSNDTELLKHFIDENNQDEYIKLYNEYTSNGEIPVLGIRELYENNIFSILDGKKEKEIKNFKRKVVKQSEPLPSPGVDFIMFD